VNPAAIDRNLESGCEEPDKRPVDPIVNGVAALGWMIEARKIGKTAWSATARLSNVRVPTRNQLQAIPCASAISADMISTEAITP